MEERSVSKRMVIEAIKNPNKIEKSNKTDTRVLVKKIYFNKAIEKDHLLLVVCEIFAEKIEIVTIIDTSKISKYY
jgi:hypothetical protein